LRALTLIETVLQCKPKAYISYFICGS